jgi:hypothetical protein
MADIQASHSDSAATPPTAASPAPAAATLEQIIDEQERIFAERQPESRRLAGLASGSLAGGVTSSWQITRP